MQGARNKIRLQVHLGDDLELRCKLLGYGIPMEGKPITTSAKESCWFHFKAHIFSGPVFPFTDSNNIKTKNYQLWIRGRKAIEEVEERKRSNNDKSPIHLIECPSSVDVVFKAGTSNVTHPGNTAFRDLLFAYHDQFFNAQQETVTMIIQCVEMRQGRFLEWNTCGCWVVMQDEGKIRTKIYTSMFYFKKTLNAKKSLQVSSSSTFLFERQDGNKRKREPDGSEPRGCTKACSVW
jgi:hypothetical protein